MPALVSCAEMEMMRGKEKDALKTYEKVLTLDGDNLQATSETKRIVKLRISFFKYIIV